MHLRSPFGQVFTTDKSKKLSNFTLILGALFFVLSSIGFAVFTVQLFVSMLFLVESLEIAGTELLGAFLFVLAPALASLASLKYLKVVVKELRNREQKTG